MDRRKSIKTLVLGTASAGTILNACGDNNNKNTTKTTAPISTQDSDLLDRMPEEITYDQKLREETFFTNEELATVAILADIIIPKDEVSGSATEAGVPAFIEFMMKDRPEFQIPMRGGIRWIDLQCLNRFEKSFRDCSEVQQLEVIDDIAYPKKVKPQYRQGASFFKLMRNLTVSGFYTSEAGFKDIGYMGNTPNQWNGVPEDVLKQYNLSYTEKELKECLSFD